MIPLVSNLPQTPLQSCFCFLHASLHVTCPRFASSVNLRSQDVPSCGTRAMRRQQTKPHCDEGRLPAPCRLAAIRRGASQVFARKMQKADAVILAHTGVEMAREPCCHISAMVLSVCGFVVFRASSLGGAEASHASTEDFSMPCYPWHGESWNSRRTKSAKLQLAAALGLSPPSHPEIRSKACSL